MYFLCRHLNSNTEHNLLIPPSIQNLFCIISGSPETFLNQTSTWGKTAYDCYSMKSQKATRTKKISWLIIFSHKTKLSSILWNHWKGTKLSLKTEGNVSGSDWRRKGRGSANGLVNGCFYDELPPLKSQYMLFSFKLHSSRNVLIFVMFTHRWILNVILVILTWLYRTWFPKEFHDSIRHLAWNAEKTAEGQEHCLLLSSFALPIFHCVLFPTEKTLIILSFLCVFFALT